MAIDIFSPAVLDRVVADLRDAPQVGTFLTNRYFAETSQSRTEAVFFDVLTGKPRLSPFVSPLVEGQIVQSLGFATSSFTPAYIKDKRSLEDGKAVRRRPGMPLLSALDPMAVRLMLVVQETEDQIKMASRRMEWMAAQALVFGKYIVVGEKYPAMLIDFGRDASLQITLTGTARWNDSAPVPLDNLEVWSGIMRDVSGSTPIDVIMAQNVWTAFRKNADVKALLAAGKFSNSTSIDIGPMATPYGKATYKGDVGSFRIFIYPDSYTDDSNVSHTYIPPGYLVMVSSDIEGVRHFGGIKDEEAGFQVKDYFIKSWTQPDPAVRFLMLQSAPLVVPYRINASLAAKVL